MPERVNNPDLKLTTIFLLILFNYGSLLTNIDTIKELPDILVFNMAFLQKEQKHNCNLSMSNVGEDVWENMHKWENIPGWWGQQTEKQAQYHFHPKSTHPWPSQIVQQKHPQAYPLSSPATWQQNNTSKPVTKHTTSRKTHAPYNFIYIKNWMINNCNSRDMCSTKGKDIYRFCKLMRVALCDLKVRTSKDTSRDKEALDTDYLVTDFNNMFFDKFHPFQPSTCYIYQPKIKWQNIRYNTCI